MANVTKSRLIYTSGTFELTDELRTCRRITIYIDVLRRPPSAIYQNERMNPPKNFMGYFSIFIGDYVYEVKPLEYDSQIALFYDNTNFQLYKQINCVGALVIDAVVALGVAMTPPAILIPTTPEPASFPGCPFSIIKFKLEALTRIRVTAFGEETFGCDGVSFPVDILDLEDDIPPYPPERPLDQDPGRSDPEPSENPGDTTPPSPDDPDLSLAEEGFWEITYTVSSGGTANATYPGTSSDTFELEVPGSGCALSGSSQLVRNGTEVLDTAFNCNSAGFVSTLTNFRFYTVP